MLELYPHIDVIDYFTGKCTFHVTQKEKIKNKDQGSDNIHAIESGHSNLKGGIDFKNQKNTSQVESRRPAWSAKCHWYVHLM